MTIQEYVVPLSVVAVMSYLLGSLNFAIITVRLFKGDDIRRHGSGNAGMTNVLRTYGSGLAVMTALGDFFKAALAVVLAGVIFERYQVPEFVHAGYVAGLFVLLGHLYPVFFRFKGGKGVMSSLGIIFCVDPLVFLIIVVLFVPIVFIFKIVSLASVLGAVGFPIITLVVGLITGSNAVLMDTLCAMVIMALVIFTHRENIKRLLSGTENRFGKKR